MNTLHLAENISSLRRKKGVTQEEMAAFLGVTKAAVSKWENGQSMPDIVLLPQLASYFDVTVDSLLGYEPQLSREQIQKIYHELAAKMAREDFEKVFAESEQLVKKYYACYPFLYQMCVLWLNHFMLAPEEQRRHQLLEKISELCSHIIENSADMGLCSDATILNAVLKLQSGKPEETVEMVEELLDPYRQVRQSDSVLIQAYMMLGETKKADGHAQIIMFNQLLALTGTATYYLMIHAEEPEICDETIRRISQITEAYRLKELNPNTVAIFYYHAAIVKCMHGRQQESLDFLKEYVELALSIVQTDCYLHGDSYFTGLDAWFENMDQGTQLLRDKRLILKSTIESLEHPAFESIRGQEEFAALKERLILV